MPGSNCTGAPERSYPTSEVRGSGQEEQPHVQGAVAVWVQEGQEEQPYLQGQVAVRAQKDLEEIFHVQGQKGRW